VHEIEGWLWEEWESFIYNPVVFAVTSKSNIFYQPEFKFSQRLQHTTESEAAMSLFNPTKILIFPQRKLHVFA